MELSLLVRGLLSVLFVYGLVSVARQLLKHAVIFPETIAIVGVRKEFFSIARASLRQLTGGITTLLSGYSQVNNMPLSSDSMLTAIQLTY